MYQYKYIPVDTGGGFLSDTREHRELIDAYAAEGWRYVGFFPVSFTSHGGISRVDLIFERGRKFSISCKSNFKILEYPVILKLSQGD